MEVNTSMCCVCLLIEHIFSCLLSSCDDGLNYCGLCLKYLEKDHKHFVVSTEIPSSEVSILMMKVVRSKCRSACSLFQADQRQTTAVYCRVLRTLDHYRFEMSFSGSSDTNHGSLLQNTTYTYTGP